MDDSDSDQKPLDVVLARVGAVDVDDAVSSSSLMLLMAFWENARRFSLLLGMLVAPPLQMLPLAFAGAGASAREGFGGGAFSMTSVGDRLAAIVGMPAALLVLVAEGGAAPFFGFMIDRGGAGITSTSKSSPEKKLSGTVY